VKYDLYLKMLSLKQRAGPAIAQAIAASLSLRQNIQSKASPLDSVIGLTLRRLMLYIYMEHPFLMFLDHTQRRSTVGRTPLDE